MAGAIFSSSLLPAQQPTAEPKPFAAAATASPLAWKSRAQTAQPAAEIQPAAANRAAAAIESIAEDLPLVAAGNAAAGNAETATWTAPITTGQPTLAKSQPAAVLGQGEPTPALRVVDPSVDGQTKVVATQASVLRWRSRTPEGHGPAANVNRNQPGIWRDRDTKLHSNVRVVAFEEDADPFQDPFGDLIAQAKQPAAGTVPPRRRDPAFQPLDNGAGKIAGDENDAAPSKPALDAESPPLLDLPQEPAGAAKPPIVELAPQVEEPAAFDSQPRPDATLQPEASAEPRRSPLTDDAPAPPSFNPAPDDTATDASGEPCQQVYNGRNCCDEDRKCKSARERLQQNPINMISLDITAPFKPDSISDEQELEARDNLLRRMPARTWRNRTGEIIASGKLAGIRNRKVEIQTEDGETVNMHLTQLSDDDWCFLAAWWGVPTECSLGDQQFVARSFEPMTMAWKASALCHKPLYFEEVQLERYGHTVGPVLQPVVSGAHFFGSIVVLPYQMGIHPPNECQYTLGYYRPGNCAPWLVPPVPLSLRGAAYQTGAVLGAIYLVP